MTIRGDNRLADAPMSPVDCRRCAATVLVRKASGYQTSVQWSRAALECCPERRDADTLSAHGTRTVFLACSALKAAIAEAVRQGDLPIVDESIAV